MDRIDFLGFALLIREINRLDRYSTRHFVLQWIPLELCKKAQHQEVTVPLFVRVIFRGMK